MDPNACLADIRALRKDIQEREDNGLRMDEQDVMRLVELMDALDEWLSAPKRGFLPAAWNHPPF